MSVFGYIHVYLTALFFSYLAINAPLTYEDLIGEDSWVENFTAIQLFLAGLLLIVTGFMERRTLPRCIYILGGIALLFGAGEEISWGQRMFGFRAPEYIMLISRQQTFTIHNLKVLFPFHRIEWYGTLIFCIMVYAAYAHKKDMILGVPLPSIPLVFAFMILLSHTIIRYGPMWFPPFVSSPVIVLLLLFYHLYVIR